MTDGAGPGLALRQELLRKLLHASTALVPVAYAAGLPRRWTIALLGAGLSVAVVVEVARRRSVAAAARFEGAVGGLLRPRDRTGLAGATWLLLGFFTAALAAPAAAAVAGMWAVAAGDASAAVVGRIVGGPRLLGNKTWAGAVAGFAMTAAGAWGLAGLSWPVALMAGATGAAAELPDGPLDDNLRIALLVTAVTYIAII